MRADHDEKARDARAANATARGAARLLAVQALYQIDIRGGSADSTILEFLQHRTEEMEDGEETRFRVEADRALFADIVRGVVRDRAEIESALDGCLDGKTSVARLELLLRVIMSSGVFELRSRPDVPARVAVSEYVHVTDAFFDGREPGLVNAVLDRLARVLRPDETNPTGAAENGAAD
jgi:N utilization substance protein B